MKNLLVLQNIQVENANAVFGITSGFPGISHFLGFSHALSRKLNAKYKLTLGDCAVVCHEHEIKNIFYKKFRDPVFTLTRNPLLQNGAIASFNEEGKMHLNISLIIECHFSKNKLPFKADCEEDKIKNFEDYILSEILKQKLAGGNIIKINKVSYYEMPEKEEDIERYSKKILYSLLPGFFLINRSSYLKEYHAKKMEENPQQEILDSWLDFYTLQFAATQHTKDNNEETTVSWDFIKKPYSGYLVPLAVGYQPLTKVINNDSVNFIRDSISNFCIVEPAYSIGEWKSPHKIKNLSDVFWSYHFDNNFYSFFK